MDGATWAAVAAVAPEDRSFVEWSVKTRSELKLDDNDEKALGDFIRAPRPDKIQVPASWWDQLVVQACTTLVDKHVAPLLAELCAGLLHRTVALERPALTRMLKALLQPPENTPDMSALMDAFYQEQQPEWDVDTLRRAMTILEDHFDKNTFTSSPEWAPLMKESVKRASAHVECVFQLQIRLGTSMTAMAARDYLTAPPESAIASLSAWMDHLDKVVGPLESERARYRRALRWLREAQRGTGSEAEAWINGDQIDRYISYDQVQSIKARIKDHAAIQDPLERMDKDFALADIISQSFVSNAEDPILPIPAFPRSALPLPKEQQQEDDLLPVSKGLDLDIFALRTTEPKEYQNTILTPMRLAATQFSTLLGAPPTDTAREQKLDTAMFGREKWSLYYRSFFGYSQFGQEDNVWTGLASVLVHPLEEQAQWPSEESKWNWVQSRFARLVAALDALETANVRSGSGWVTDALWNGAVAFSNAEDREYHNTLSIAKGAHGLALVMAIRAALYCFKDNYAHPYETDDARLTDDQRKALLQSWEDALLRSNLHVAYWRMLWAEYGANWFDRTAMPIRWKGTRARRLAQATGDAVAWLGMGFLSTQTEKSPAASAQTTYSDAPVRMKLSAKVHTQLDGWIETSVNFFKNTFQNLPITSEQSESLGVLNGTSSLQSAFLETCIASSKVDFTKVPFNSERGYFLGMDDTFYGPKIYVLQVDALQDATVVQNVVVSAREFASYLIEKGKALPLLTRREVKDPDLINVNMKVDRSRLPEWGMCIPKSDTNASHELLKYIWGKVDKTKLPEVTLRRIFESLSLSALIDPRTVFDAVKLTSSFCIGTGPVRLASTIVENVLFQPPATVAQFRDAPMWQQSGGTTSWLELCKDGFLGTNPARRMRTAIDDTIMREVALTPFELQGGDPMLAFGKLVAEATLRAAGRTVESQTVSFLASALHFGIPAPCWILLAMAVRYATLDPVRSLKSVVLDMLLVAFMGAIGVTSWEKISPSMTAAFALTAVAIVGAAEFWPYMAALATRVGLKK